MSPTAAPEEGGIRANSVHDFRAEIGVALGGALTDGFGICRVAA